MLAAHVANRPVKLSLRVLPGSRRAGSLRGLWQAVVRKHLIATGGTETHRRLGLVVLRRIPALRAPRGLRDSVLLQLDLAEEAAEPLTRLHRLDDALQLVGQARLARHVQRPAHLLVGGARILDVLQHEAHPAIVGAAQAKQRSADAVGPVPHAVGVEDDVLERRRQRHELLLQVLHPAAVVGREASAARVLEHPAARLEDEGSVALLALRRLLLLVECVAKDGGDAVHPILVVGISPAVDLRGIDACLLLDVLHRGDQLGERLLEHAVAPDLVVVQQLALARRADGLDELVPQLAVKAGQRQPLAGDPAQQQRPQSLQLRLGDGVHVLVHELGSLSRHLQLGGGQACCGDATAVGSSLCQRVGQVAALLAGGGAAGSALLHGAHTLAPRRLVALLALLHVLLGEAGDQLRPLQRLALHELRAVEREEELELGGVLGMRHLLEDVNVRLLDGLRLVGVGLRVLPDLVRLPAASHGVDCAPQQTSRQGY